MELSEQTLRDWLWKLERVTHRGHHCEIEEAADAVAQSIKAALRRPTPEPQGEAVAVVPLDGVLNFIDLIATDALNFIDLIATDARGLRHEYVESRAGSLVRVPDFHAMRPNEQQPGEGGGEVTCDMVESACVSMYEDWARFHQHERENFRKTMRAALTAALAKGGQGG